VLYQSYKDLTVGENSSGQVHLQYYINCCVRSLSVSLAPSSLLSESSDDG